MAFLMMRNMLPSRHAFEIFNLVVGQSAQMMDVMLRRNFPPVEFPYVSVQGARTAGEVSSPGIGSINSPVEFLLGGRQDFDAHGEFSPFDT